MQTDKPGSLADKFGDFGAAPTDQLWNSIAASLDQKETKKRGAFWWWFGGIAAGVLFIFAVYQVGYHFGKQDVQVAENSQLSADESGPADLTSSEKAEINATKSDAVNLNETENNDVITTSENSSLENTASVTQNFVRADFHSPNSVTPTSVRADFHSPNSVTPNFVRTNLHSPNVATSNLVSVDLHSPYFVTPSLVNTGEITDAEISAMPLTTIENLVVFTEPVFNLRSAGIEKRKSTNRWELGFAVGTLAAYQATNQKIEAANIPTQGLTNNQSMDVDEFAITGSGFTPAPAVNNVSPQVNASVKRPLSVEFTIARTLGRRWSVGSGVGLNYFAAKNSYAGSGVLKTQADFLSVSVPLVIDFDFVKRKRFEISAGSGVVNEFPFRMNSVTTFVNPTVAKGESKQFISGYMGSVLFRTGISYNLNEHLKIGLSPNVRYYFHQSMQSEIPVLKRNLWGGVSVGLTWNL